MARGDLTVFDEGLLAMLVEDWAPTDAMWIGIVTNVCLEDDPIPAYAAGGTTNYTAIATAGTYAAGGLIVDTITDCFSEVGGTVTFDGGNGAAQTEVSWAQNGSNPQDGDHAVIYHNTSGLATVMIDLAGPIDMQAGDLTITWNPSGIFTIAK